MLVAEEGEVDARAVGVPRDEAREDGVNEKRVAAVDEEIELLSYRGDRPPPLPLPTKGRGVKQIRIPGRGLRRGSAGCCGA
jgi:hypothetical protein